MKPVAAAESWEIPSISSGGDLAAWLGLSIGELQVDFDAIESMTSTAPPVIAENRVVSVRWLRGLPIMNAPPWM